MWRTEPIVDAIQKQTVQPANMHTGVPFWGPLLLIKEMCYLLIQQIFTSSLPLFSLCFSFSLLLKSGALQWSVTISVSGCDLCFTAACCSFVLWVSFLDRYEHFLESDKHRYCQIDKLIKYLSHLAYIS